jgi:hypothetical protein
MINRSNVRITAAALIGIASLCFPACGPEDSTEPEPTPVDPARNPHDDPTIHDGLGQPVAEPGPEQVWKITAPSDRDGDRRERTCVLPSAAAALPSTEIAADRFGTTEPPVVCRAGTTGLVPIAPLPAGDVGDQVQVVQRE